MCGRGRDVFLDCHDRNKYKKRVRLFARNKYDSSDVLSPIRNIPKHTTAHMISAIEFASMSPILSPWFSRKVKLLI